MKSITDIFAELGNRLANFGNEAVSQSIIQQASAENEWFTDSDIRYAVEAIRCEMLDKDKISQWLSLYPTLGTHTPKRVAIIMAGNIPLVGFFDLMCVIASGNIPCVKPSSKDRVLEDYIEQLLCSIEPSLCIERYEEGAEYDAIIATGSDIANLYFSTHFSGIPSLLRGSRHSVAVLSGEEDTKDLELLADDIFIHSGLGCRNVSLIFAPKGFKPKFTTRKMCRAYHNNYLQCRALLTMQGVEFEDLGEALLVESDEAKFPRFLSHISIVEYTSLDDVKSWLKANDDKLQCVVSTISGAHSRQTPFGKAQRPSLFDYADERDTMQFLSSTV